MKYILPLVVSLLLTACDSSSSPDPAAYPTDSASAADGSAADGSHAGEVADGTAPDTAGLGDASGDAGGDLPAPPDAEVGAGDAETDAVAPADVGEDAADTPGLPDDATADVTTDDTGDDTADDTGADATDDTADMGGSDTSVAPLHVPTAPGCEDLNPLDCVLPWPSDRFLAVDPSTETGYRVALAPEAIPTAIGGAPFDVSPYSRLDGVSAATHLATLFEEPADLQGVASHDDIGTSLTADHPTVILDRTTGERVAHWVENDARADSPEETLLYLRPASRLAPNRGYIVAIRGLKGQSGQPLAPSAAFLGLRDQIPTDADSIEARRAGFEDAFEELATAGIARENLQAAWSFHTGSDTNLRATLLAMRADALQRLGPDGLGCTVTSVQEGFKGLGRLVRGTYQVPRYMSADAPPGVIVRDAAGLPLYQTTRPVAFTAVVPDALLMADAPGPLITWGHGLFGDADGTLAKKEIFEVANASGTVIVGTDWEGMSSKNLPFLATALLDVSKFFMVGEWLQQGMINQVALTRSFIGDCGLLPELASTAGAPVIDPTTRYFVGGSQGSILGGTLLTISPDIERGALIVGGAGFSFMIERSIHYTTFGALLTPSYPSRLAQGTLMLLSQHVWDNAETAAWLGAAAEGLPGIGPKRFLYLITANDAQVANLSSDIAARLSGIPVLQGSVREPWGVPVVPGPIDGSAFVAFDVGDGPVPYGNLAPDHDDGGHGAVGFTAEAQAMIQHFLTTGQVILTCDGTCDLTQ